MAPTRADVAGWIHEGEYQSGAARLKVSNIAVRAPEGVLGIDSDAYVKDGKQRPGAATMAALAAECGPLPRTWRSTSRPGTDSGHDWYRVPVGLSWADQPGVEMIHHGHRYSVTAPSIHPEGREYEWVSPDGEITTTPPNVADLPALPEAWVARLSRPPSNGKADLDDEALGAAYTSLPKGEPCRHVASVQARALQAFAEGAGRHPTARTATDALVHAGRRGCPGVHEALKVVKAAYLKACPGEQEARAKDYSALVVGALKLAAAEYPTQGTQCSDEVPDYIPDPPEAEQAPVGAPPDDYAATVARKAAELRILDEARGIVAAEKARAAYTAPPVWSLSALVASTTAEVVAWTFEGLAEKGDRLLIEAAAKTGKTTLVANLVESLVTGEPLLGTFAATPIPPGSVVLYIDTELGPRKLSRWLADVIPASARERVAVWSIAGRTGSLDVRDADTRARMAADVRASIEGRPVAYVVIDVAAAWAAPLGIEENSNTEVRRFLEALHTFALDLGADGMALAHHAGHGAERSRGASAFRDWPDVYVTLAKDGEEDSDARYLSAQGRDVEVPESRLTFDHDTRRLSLSGSVGVSRRRASRERVAAEYADTIVEVVDEHPGMGSKELRAALAEVLASEGRSVKRAAVGEAVKLAESTGRIVNLGDRRKSCWHTPETAKQERGHPRGHPQTTETADTPRVSPGCPQGVPVGVPRVSPTPGDTQAAGGVPVSPPLIQGVDRTPAPTAQPPKPARKSSADDIFEVVAE